MGFVGPNGAGKSTTMKIICGLLKPHSGRVSVEGITCSENAQVYLSKMALSSNPRRFTLDLTAKTTSPILHA